MGQQAEIHVRIDIAVLSAKSAGQARQAGNSVKARFLLHWEAPGFDLKAFN